MSQAAGDRPQACGGRLLRAPSRLPTCSAWASACLRPAVTRGLPVPWAPPSARSPVSPLVRPGRSRLGVSGCSHGHTTVVAGQGGQWQRLSPACNFSPETQTWTSPWTGRPGPALGSRAQRGSGSGSTVLTCSAQASRLGVPVQGYRCGPNQAPHKGT